MTFSGCISWFAFCFILDHRLPYGQSKLSWTHFREKEKVLGFTGKNAVNAGCALGFLS